MLNLGDGLHAFFYPFYFYVCLEFSKIIDCLILKKAGASGVWDRAWGVVVLIRLFYTFHLFNECLLSPYNV